MPKRERLIREIVRGLEGLMTLNEWEQTLLKDLRAKAEDGLRLGPEPERPRPREGGEKP
jgi:hypothetical protein